jgi:hypothetical protein
MTEKDKVIDFSKKFYERTGTKPKKQRLKKFIKINEDTLVTKLALEILKVLQPHKESNPLATAAAVLLVGHTLIKEYTDRIGTAKTRELVELAEAISKRFKPGYSDARTLEADQEDKPER